MAERDENGRFAPGWKGGPGRPRDADSLTNVLKTVVDREALATILYERAMAGDVTALKYIFDRWDGKPIETIDNNIFEAPEVVTIHDGRPISDRQDNGSDSEQEKV